MEVNLLKQIVKNTAHKTSFQIIVSDSKSRFKTRFNPTLQLDRDKEYEIALVNLETIFSSAITFNLSSVESFLVW